MGIGPDLRSPTDRLDDLQQKIDTLVERVEKLEQGAGDHDNQITQLENEVADLEAQIEDREWLRFAFRALVADLDHTLGIEFMPLNVRLQIEELEALL